ncbi:MAG: DUF4132 domain-containing protein [Adlercreutzia sp.]|nr:DUF4132 domain-containing protein [Adlercreutzia sp.]
MSYAAQPNKERLDRIAEKTENPLVKALCKEVLPTYQRNLGDIIEELDEIYGQSVYNLSTLDEFFSLPVTQAMAEIVGEEEVENFKVVAALLMEGQISRSPYRRSYRSRAFAFHAQSIIEAFLAFAWSCLCDETVIELLSTDTMQIWGHSYRFAAELAKGNQEVEEIIRETMLGQRNTEVLSRAIINALFISGNTELLQLLMDMLLAARLQEGFRQAVLENADAGSRVAFVSVFRLCMEEDLFRYSSAARALYTWTGLAWAEPNPRFTKALASCAFECLTDRQARDRYRKSSNPLECYLAFWADATEEVTDAYDAIDQLLASKEKQRRLVGWLFVDSTEAPAFQHATAMEHLEEPDDETLAWALDNLAVNHAATHYYAYAKLEEVKERPWAAFPEEASERRAQFDALSSLVSRLSPKAMVFEESLFPFMKVELSREKPIDCLLSLCAYDLDETLIARIADLLPLLTADQRGAFYMKIVDPDKSEFQRTLIYRAFGDKSVYNKRGALRKLAVSTSVTADDIDVVCDALKSKSNEFRKDAIAFLSERPTTLQNQAVRLLAHGKEPQVQAAIELLLKSDELIQKNRGLVQEIREGSWSAQTQALVDQLPDDTPCGEEDGQFFPSQEAVAEEAIANLEKRGAAILPHPCSSHGQGRRSGALSALSRNRRLNARQLQALMPQEHDVERLFERLNAVIERHGDFEYETLCYDGSREMARLGDVSYRLWPLADLQDTSQGPETLAMIPFAGEFRSALEPFRGTAVDTLMLGFAVGHKECYGIDAPFPYRLSSWYRKAVEPIASTLPRVLAERYGDRAGALFELIRLSLGEMDQGALLDAALPLYLSVLDLFGPDELFTPCLEQEGKGTRLDHFGNKTPAEMPPVRFFRDIITRLDLSDAQLERWLAAELPLEHRSGYQLSSIKLGHLARAIARDIVPEACLCPWVKYGSPRNLRELSAVSQGATAQGEELGQSYPWLIDAARAIVSSIVESEALRGQLPTPFSVRCYELSPFPDASMLCKLLAGIDKTGFFRGYFYRGTTKQEVLSFLVSRCFPSTEDTAETLRLCAQQAGIDDIRLVDTAMYAPQWAKLVERATGWEGLASAVWFFHAHIDERFSAAKETEVAYYSPLSPEQFNEGAFDADWFIDVYTTLGKKRFDVLYKSARFISQGNAFYKRSQIFVDAALGKLEARALEEEIARTRNKDKLRAYAVVPLGKQREKEIARRYEFIRKFEHESKAFGAQRRSSEARAVLSALQNLASTAKLGSVERLTWLMEDAIREADAPFFEGATIDDYHVAVSIDERGQASLDITRRGKRLKSVPSPLRKHPTVAAFKEEVGRLRNQRERVTAIMESMMVDGTPMLVSELLGVLSNPALAPLAASLLWIDDAGVSGFPVVGSEGLCLENARGSHIPLSSSQELCIAHPFHLLAEGTWGPWMRIVIERGIVQPFKQALREFYPMTADEKKGTSSTNRYSGNQIQPKKAAALLKRRGWTVDYEEGLQKVNRRKDVTVRMYALADWFSPADMEYPTIEEVSFFDGRGSTSRPIEEIDPILFSEAMRDIDLAVSVAHAGGVDPEASHSTVEMRIAIAKEMTALLGLDNVSFGATHATIAGSRGIYSVHMGSGIIHGQERGMISVIPVHSQHRGRLFLPLMDDDPKTAEIISKIVLFAEDEKITDPSILAQIR